jgi:hypothetical protein
VIDVAAVAIRIPPGPGTAVSLFRGLAAPRPDARMGIHRCCPTTGHGAVFAPWLCRACSSGLCGGFHASDRARRCRCRPEQSRRSSIVP